MLSRNVSAEPLISIVIAYFYPITRAHHAEIERQLAERRAVAEERQIAAQD